MTNREKKLIFRELKDKIDNKILIVNKQCKENKNCNEMNASIYNLQCLSTTVKKEYKTNRNISEEELDVFVRKILEMFTMYVNIIRIITEEREVTTSDTDN